MQRRGEAADKGRQQQGRRHGTLRSRTRLPGAQGHHRQRRRIRAVCGLRDDYAVGAPVAEDGHAGLDGSNGCAATRISRPRRGHGHSRRVNQKNYNLMKHFLNNTSFNNPVTACHVRRYRIIIIASIKGIHTKIKSHKHASPRCQFQMIQRHYTPKLFVALLVL